MKQVEIARAMGLSKGAVLQRVYKGMPTDSIEAAKAWWVERIANKNEAKRKAIEHELAMRKMRAIVGYVRTKCEKKYTIQSPDGARYTFIDIDEWCRQHENLLGGQWSAKMFKNRIHSAALRMDRRGNDVIPKLRGPFWNWVLISVEDL